jgi:hypothetical protein
MTPEEKRELMHLLEERTLSSFERRKRRLLEIPMSNIYEALSRSRAGLALTKEQFIVASMGFTPEEVRAEHAGKA